MRPLKRPAGTDPAPSKWQYRMQRLWLTPLFRALVRTGIPSFGFVFLFTWYINDPVRVTAIVDGYESIIRSFQDRPEFMVGLLRIEGASDQLQSDIQEALPIDLPLSQFQLDIDALHAALVSLDPVLDAEVRVKSGGVLLLKITERQPAVAWIQDGKVEVLDATGHRVATLDDIASAGALPLIAGEGAETRVPEALTLIGAATPITDRLIGLTRVGNRRWDVVLTRGQRIALPEDGPAAALDRALAMHAVKDVLSRDVTVVDLRLPGRPVLRLSPAARAELKDLQELERLSLSLSEADIESIE
ncbi:cell division protein FtsQ/DivIB [Jannaschia rubra]|uniref:Cell division protein FtsQ n=1 Tax=Jannaschia rubra TaxID=282197 RepID=A0A0M6XP69_9RHOB|nr:cell division protein FtsQ/DivIB [Jannaschia rubra]CTQ32397.1 Cell division protein FtsQ [Jannaschia rubra]SFG45329.1 cell division protein FtsQ [Jannaschia rubra]